MDLTMYNIMNRHTISIVKNYVGLGLKQLRL